MTSVSAIANEFLTLAEKDNSPITNLKLVKLCYIVQGVALAALNKPAFSESIEAWRYGPVIPSIYHEFKRFKNNPITDKSICDDNGEYSEPILKDEDLKKAVLVTWGMHKKTSAQTLIRLTHAEGTPWSYTYVPNQNRVIDNSLIKEYYIEFLKRFSASLKDAAE